MSQFGFFDADRRLSVLSLKGDPLVEILALVPWEQFRTDIETVVLTAAGSKKSIECPTSTTCQAAASSRRIRRATTNAELATASRACRRAG